MVDCSTSSGSNEVETEVELERHFGSKATTMILSDFDGGRVEWMG